MRPASIIASSGLASGSLALVPRDGTCCFHLTSYGGGPSGIVGQLSDGQNRVGQNNLPTPEGQYCLSHSGLTDGSGRGCILTPPTTQFQCDVGATPTPGFGISCNGTLTHDNGDNTFVVCPTGDNGGWNIYTKPVANQPQCTPIWLQSDGCHSQCTPPPAPVAPPAKDQCPMRLPQNFEFPHLIIPVDSKNPDKAHGTSYNGTVSSTVSSIFNFDVPASNKGKTCTLHFIFPRAETLETSAYEFSGNGRVAFAQMSTPASQSTTFNNAPKRSADLGEVSIAPGNTYAVTTFVCPAGEVVSYEMSAVDDTSLDYFQDFNPCPIGMYVVAN